MSATVDTTGVQSGLEGVVAFATEIAEPDKEGGALRYRGVDIEDLVGQVPYEKVWGLLVDGTFEPGLPPAEPWPLTVRSGDPRVDVQAALAMLAPEWGFQQVIDPVHHALHELARRQPDRACPRGSLVDGADHQMAPGRFADPARGGRRARRRRRVPSSA